MGIDEYEQTALGRLPQHELNLVDIAQVDELWRTTLVKLARRDLAVDHDRAMADEDADGVEALLLNKVEQPVHTPLL